MNELINKNNDYNNTEVEVVTSEQHPWLCGGTGAWQVGLAVLLVTHCSAALSRAQTLRRVLARCRVYPGSLWRTSSIGAGGIFECV